MSHGSYDSNLGSEILILAGDIMSRIWPNIGGTYGTIFKTDITKEDLVFSISNFFINKISLGRNRFSIQFDPSTHSFPWILIKKLEFKKTKPTWYTIFKTDITKEDLVFSISNFLLTKFPWEGIGSQYNLTPPPTPNCRRLL
jgi:hypothetical protein